MNKQCLIKNILISDSTSYKAIVIAKHIKEKYKGANVFTCSHKTATKILHTRYSDKHFILNSKGPGDSSYVEELLKLVSKLNIDFYFPVNSEEMENILKQKDRFGKSLSYWGSHEQFSVLNEKNRLYDLAQTIGIRIPEKYTSIEEAKIPFVAKPKKSSSSKGVAYVKSEKDLSKLKLKNLDSNNYVIQEYIKGTGIGYSVLASGGKIKVGYGHIRLAEYPVAGGSSVYRGSFNHPEMHKIADRLLKKTNWSGFAMFEFKLMENNHICLIEVNPRIWGSINQGLQNGTDYFFPLLGNNDIGGENRLGPDIKTYLSPLLYVSLFKYCLRFRFSNLLCFIKNIFRNRVDISLFCDTLGYASMFLKL